MCRAHATGNSRQDLRAGFLLSIVFVLAAWVLAGCGSTGSDESQDDGREPAFFLGVDPPIAFVAPGDTVVAALSATGDITGSLDFSTSALPESAEAKDAVVRVRREGFDPMAALRVETAPDTLPGVYRYEVVLGVFRDEGTFERRREFVLVVMADGSEAISDSIAALAAGDDHSLAIDANGGVWAWGRNDHGQLGDGTTVDRAVPVPVSGLPGPAIEVAAGAAHSLALLADGEVFAWGSNEEDQIDPRASTRDVLVPGPARGEGGVQDAVEIAAGARHSLALLADGQIQAWGSNARFALAGFNEDSSEELIQLPFVDAVEIAAGDDFSLALADDGSAWGWGASGLGQLGSVVGSPQRTPIDIGFVSGVVGVAAGFDHTLLLLDDGNIGALGRNTSGQLGDGSLVTPAAQPTRPPFLQNVVEADGGALHSLALQQDGRVFAWGDNSFGQVSDEGNQTPDGGSGRILQRVPVPLTRLPQSAGIAAGRRHSLSIAESCGQVWSWGDDAVGQLGSGQAQGAGGFRAEAQPVVGLGEATLGSGCPVLLTLASRGPGRVSAAGSGIQDADCSGPACTARFPVDEVVILDAVAGDDGAFVSWGGSCTGTDPTTSVTLDRSRSCVAHFNALPVATFTADPNPVSPGFLVDLDARASSDRDGEIVSYEWDFESDGIIDDSGDSLFFSSDTTGTFPVKLRVTDELGGMGETVVEVVVDRGPPAVIQVFPESVTAGETAHFEAEQLAEIARYEWDFEDDGTFDATGPVVDHVFPSAGERRVRLRVTGTDGLTGTRSVVVQVVPPAGDTATVTVVPDGGGDGTVITTDGLLSCSFSGAASTPSPCTLTVPTGTTVDLYPFQAEGFFFSHWRVGDCDSQFPGDPSPVCRVTLTADRTVRVSFE